MNSCQANAAACCSVAFVAPPSMSDGNAGLTSIATCPVAKPPDPRQMHTVRPANLSGLLNEAPPHYLYLLSSQNYPWVLRPVSHRSTLDQPRTRGTRQRH